MSAPTKTKTQIQVLLAAALCAAADWWEENGADGHARRWDHLLEDCELYLLRRDKIKMGVREAAARRFRDFAYAVNREEKCWRLPRHRTSVGSYRNVPGRPVYHWQKKYVAPWEWCQAMADALIAHVKARAAAEAPR
jgi:hypothetical protein